MTQDLSDDLTARIALAAATDIGDQYTHRIVARYGPSGALDLAQRGTVPSGLTRSGFDSWRTQILARHNPYVVQQAIALGEEHRLTMLTPDDPAWQNSGIADLGSRAPLALWTQGDESLLDRPRQQRLTVTGARANTSYGQHATDTIIQELAADDENYVIVAGGAYGIDRSAHQAAIAARTHTIAVLPSGIDRPYPQGNRELLSRLGHSGQLLLSETPPGMVPTRHRLEERHRLMAAISSAVVVVEAGSRSSTFFVVDAAEALHRPIGAVPGPVTSATSNGPHLLIRDGRASLVTSGADVRRLIETGTSRPPALQRDARSARRQAPLADVRSFGNAQSRDQGTSGLTR
ncbi:DNA-binding protein [Leucobacter sp. UCD-THU]|uniref:DNA-processing protein DprA n=1 Tax=Leucobacter sp. UCD-THU TaxID=1292023 RepID=UPI000371E426|nr:DNA-processing protein DprA [Leucobacter sp. UCD-THU]EYT56588.1 DNA-binding protein [Leucobacter sp. UCD-THU]